VRAIGVEYIGLEILREARAAHTAEESGWKMPREA
jgi:hypothetical protein